MNLTRTFLFLAALAFSATASAADDGWRIVQSTGTVKAGGSGFMPAAVRPDQSLPRDSWVETGDTGRVVLVRGSETIALGPNARVQLPSQEVNGNTQVLQTLGSALYQIGKQKKPHFQVDTPYLAAVVKGTTFTVSVGEEVSSVDVTEGLVQVATPDGSDTEYVSPGFTGIVSKTNAGHVVVTTTQHAPAAPEAAPTKSSDKSASDNSNDKGRAMIATAIGETVVDVKEVSGGLANGIDNAVSNGAGNKLGLASVSAATTDENGRSNGSANGGGVSSVATVDVASTSLSVEVGNGNGNGNADGLGNGNGGASVDVDLGASNGNGVGVGLGNSNGNGVGVTVDLDLGGSNGIGNGAGNGLGLGVGLGNGNGGNGGGNGNGGGLGLGLGNGNGLGLGLGKNK
jgi:FecR protein